MKQKWLLPKAALVVHHALTASRAVPYSRAPLTDNDTVSTPAEICRILKHSGAEAKLFPLAQVGDLRRLRLAPTDFIFNCTEDDIGTKPNSAHLVPQIAGYKRVPYTGATSGNILLTGNKAAAKEFCLRGAIPTPDFWVAARAGQINELPFDRGDFFPAMVKPVAADGSEGISQKSVVNDVAGLTEQVKKIIAVFKQPALIEAYVFGREISQPLWETRSGPELLPPAEVVFTKTHQAEFKIVDFNSKWRKKTKEYQGTKRVCPASLTTKIKQQIGKMSLKVWQNFGLQGYARIDFRLDKHGRIWLLEVNVNPDITNDNNTTFPMAALAAGYTYEGLILHLVDAAMFNYQ